MLDNPITDEEFPLRSLQDWQNLSKCNPHYSDKEYIDTCVEKAKKDGIFSRYLGYVAPEEISVPDANYRETFSAAGFNARLRAVLDRFASFTMSADVYSVRIYAHEALTNFALSLRGRYPGFIGSEFTLDQQTRKWLYPIPVIDILDSEIPNEAFDFVFSNEVMEHVTNIEQAFKETYRILRPGGHFIATFPFLFNQPLTQINAILEDGQITHLFPPEYHGNPVNAAGKSLVFQIPGWDILDVARAAGFIDPRMIFCSSVPRGLVATEVAGIFVFEATR